MTLIGCSHTAKSGGESYFGNKRSNAKSDRLADASTHDWPWHFVYSVYRSHATRPPFSLSTTTSGAVTLSGVAAGATADVVATAMAASLIRRRTIGRVGSRHMEQSMRIQTAAERSVATARAICTHAITTRSRHGGFDSSSWMSLEENVKG